MDSWISTSQQLPPLNEQVPCLLWDEGYWVPIMAHVFCKPRGTKVQYIWEDWNGEERTQFEVKYWTRLPEYPPKPNKAKTMEVPRG